MLFLGKSSFINLSSIHDILSERISNSFMASYMIAMTLSAILGNDYLFILGWCGVRHKVNLE